MFKILKGGQCYTPEYKGKKDILIVRDRVFKLDDSIAGIDVLDPQVIDCTGKLVCPGFIDQHVHITGGGGEEGPSSRIPELMLGEIVGAGVTTLVGVLGLDNLTRNVAGLLAKARALEHEGITTFIYTGSYGVPTATLTGRAISDIAFIDKVIGVGEIALADYRSSHPSVQMLKDLAYEAMAGGMVGEKAGVMHIHIGDGKEGLGALFELIEHSDFPPHMFVPTHVNRNRALFGQALELLRKGGNIDLTAGETSGKGYTVPDAVELALKSLKNCSRITVSSDGNGSMPAGDGGIGICRVGQLFSDIKSCIVDKKVDIATVLRLVTENVARVLKLYPGKGSLSAGSDADILVLDEKEFALDKVFARGELVVDNGTPVRKGKYEK